MNRFVPGLRLLLGGVVLLAIALLPLAVSAAGKGGKPAKNFANLNRYLIAPTKTMNYRILNSQLNYFNQGTEISRSIVFYPNMFAPYNLAYSRDQPTWHSKYDIRLLSRKSLSWSVDFSADGQLSDRNSAFYPNYRKNAPPADVNEPLWKVGYPHVQYKPSDLRIRDGKTKNFRSTWHYEVKPGRGNFNERRWQVMYEIKLGIYDKAGIVRRQVWVQIELIKQGHGDREGKVVVIPGNKFSKWHLGKFDSKWTGSKNVIPVQRFSHVGSFGFIGSRKAQRLEINFFPFLEYCVANKLYGLTENHQIIDVNAGIEIGRGGRGTKFITTKYGIGVWGKQKTNSSGSPASDAQPKSRQMAAM